MAHRRRRRLPAWALTVATVLAASLLAGCDGGEPSTTEPTPTESTSPSDTPTPTETGEPSPRSTDPADIGYEQAAQVVRGASRVEDKLYRDPSDKQARRELSRYVTGLPLQQILDSADERAEQGYTGDGHTKLRWVRGDFSRPNPGTGGLVSVEICYDLSDLRITDSDGNVVEPMREVGYARYLVQTDKWPFESPRQWRVVRQDIPNEACPS
jgi:hypothetical protein